MNTFLFILDIFNIGILPIIAIILSVFSCLIARKSLKRQHQYEEKTSAPCIIIQKDEIVLGNNWMFTELNEKFGRKSINIMSNVLTRNRESELFTTLILNYSEEEMTLSDIIDEECKRFLNHAIITIKNIGNPLIRITIEKIDIIFDDKNKNFELSPQSATYYGFLDNNDTLDILITFLFNKEDKYLNLSTIPESDFKKLQNCKDKNCLNVHLSEVTNNYKRMVFHFELTNQYGEKYRQKNYFDSYNNTYTTWLEKEPNINKKI